MKMGYIRCSTLDQEIGRQVVELEQKCDRLYVDKKSGKDTNRPELQAMLLNIRQGDEILCLSMDRLSRSLKDLIGLVEEINKKGASITFLKEGLIFTGNKNDPFQKLMLSMLGAINEFYRANLLEIQRAGIQLAKKAGKYAKPRRKKLADETLNEFKELSKTMSVSALAKHFGISRPTCYEYLKKVA